MKRQSRASGQLIVYTSMVVIILIAAFALLSASVVFPSKTVIKNIRGIIGHSSTICYKKRDSRWEVDQGRLRAYIKSELFPGFLEKMSELSASISESSFNADGFSVKTKSNDSDMEMYVVVSWDRYVGNETVNMKLWQAFTQSYFKHEVYQYLRAEEEKWRVTNGAPKLQITSIALGQRHKLAENNRELTVSFKITDVPYPSTETATCRGGGYSRSMVGIGEGSVCRRIDLRAHLDIVGRHGEYSDWIDVSGVNASTKCSLVIKMEDEAGQIRKLRSQTLHLPE